MEKCKLIENCKNNLPYLLLVGLSIINLYYMHQFFAINGYIESELYLYSFPVNFFATIFDVSLLLLFFSAILIFRRKLVVVTTYITTFLMSFVNVFYGRFFSQYLPLSAITQISSLGDGIVVDSMLSGFRWSDIYYLLSLLLVVIVLFRFCSNKMGFTLQYVILLIVLPILSLFGVFCSYTAYHLCNSTCRHNYQLFKNRQNEILFNALERKSAFPNNTKYHVGLIRPFISDVVDWFQPYTLTKEQCDLIEKGYGDKTFRKFNHRDNQDVNNVIFILLESFLSASSDLVVDNKRITPFLDSLKHSREVYYNGNVHSNITIGESADGQLIYMTGLLPLRSKVSVGIAKNDTLPSLPTILKQYFGISRTEIVIPSNPGMWQQSHMNVVYGIDNCYSQNDVQGHEMRDDVVFNLAKSTPKSKKESFFSMVLSLSTHQPYRSPIDKSFVIQNDSLPPSYLVYLNACHFLDKQIQAYFDDLKMKGIYYNSLIVIASDHAPHMEMLGMKERISAKLPLYIIHGNISVDAYVGDCNQLDVFTTILDVLNIDCDWNGLGNTLLNPNYVNSVSDEKYEMSEWIIRGNYFKMKSNLGQ